MKTFKWNKTFLSLVTLFTILVPGQFLEPQLIPDTTVAASTVNTHNAQKSKINQTKIRNASTSASVAPKQAPKPLPNVTSGNKGDAVLWLNEGLSALGYLPVQFVPKADANTQTSASTTKPASSSNSTKTTNTTDSKTNTTQTNDSKSSTKSSDPTKSTTTSNQGNNAGQSNSNSQSQGTSGKTTGGQSGVISTKSASNVVSGSTSVTSDTSKASKVDTTAKVPAPKPLTTKQINEQVMAQLAEQLKTGQWQPIKGSWTFPKGTPVSLQKLWSPSRGTVMTKAAIMAFESDHHLVSDGIAGPHVYAALQTALTKQEVAKHPYTYVTVTKVIPETLTVWQNGKKVFTSRANTGVKGAATPNGTFAVYARYTSQTMRGTNPNGTHYNDPGVPWVNYFNGGDAIHGFPRASYGTPQSVGCVELPIAAAKKVFPMLYIGTLVTIS